MTACSCHADLFHIPFSIFNLNVHAHAEPLFQYKARVLFKYVDEHLRKRIDRYADEPVPDPWERFYCCGGRKLDIKGTRHVPPLKYYVTIGNVGMLGKKII